jgi:NOL1/NOP2/fmu family ribosome biogenesis protein
MRILNRREAEVFEAKIEMLYGAKESLREFTVLLSGKDEKIWIANKDLFQIPIEKLRVNSVGLYFGRVDNGKLRLSVEGAGIIGPKADKNVVELDETHLWDFLRGFDIELKENIPETKDYVLVKHKNDWLGIAKMEGNVLKNAMPKSRKIVSLTK